jgi:hypothetical protein
MRKVFKTVSIIVLAILLLLLTRVNILAVTTPDFPACSNPKGVLIASYDDGVHGIVGSDKTYYGSDKVYLLDNGNLIQCFCSIDQNGIQTNWWKTSSLTESEIQTLKNLGWYFVPSGSPWGLDEGSYMAYNTNYSCAPGVKPTTSTSAPPICNAKKPDAPTLLSVIREGSKATITWTKVADATHYTIAYGDTPGYYPYGVPNTGNQTSYTIEKLDPSKKYFFQVYAVNECMPSDPSTNQTGGQVLGLATTGTGKVAFITTLLGLTLISTGYLLIRRQKAINR